MDLRPMEEATIYDRLTKEGLGRLIHRFYDLVHQHPLLREIFPEDLTETREKQFAFMSGFFGGPPLYMEKYGHPRLRMRHLKFPIGEGEARAWLACMEQALKDTVPDQKLREDIFAALARTAVHMINQ
ncbi:globin domain-containing protein [Deinococcus cellulosilyticus]|uniref:Globin n=1 Tax=Deinococcus cellulosilyticus (strain DSM 18568 / NBRC 106333 / KACC 11606 / 5516J-15) TaxID=1223518 RepID=A0A511N5L0_DEIC1|nr:globin [Deinococcus cellulosilyticus]GEM48159.1 hypothetical protein DC3_37940 [Deinococcus cellulosilyticus NBRC 106333 = KACC 11606]